MSPQSQDQAAQSGTTKKAHKLDTTNFISKFFFLWMTPDVNTANKKNWTQDDHQELPAED